MHNYHPFLIKAGTWHITARCYVKHTENFEPARHWLSFLERIVWIWSERQSLKLFFTTRIPPLLYWRHTRIENEFWRWPIFRSRRLNEGEKGKSLIRSNKVGLKNYQKWKLCILKCLSFNARWSAAASLICLFLLLKLNSSVFFFFFFLPRIIFYSPTPNFEKLTFIFTRTALCSVYRWGRLRT